MGDAATSQTPSEQAKPAHPYDLFVVHAASDAEFVRGYLLPALDLPVVAGVARRRPAAWRRDRRRGRSRRDAEPVHRGRAVAGVPRGPLGGVRRTAGESPQRRRHAHHSAAAHGMRSAAAPQRAGLARLHRRRSLGRRGRTTARPGARAYPGPRTDRVPVSRHARVWRGRRRPVLRASPRGRRSRRAARPRRAHDLRDRSVGLGQVVACPGGPLARDRRGILAAGPNVRGANDAPGRATRRAAGPRDRRRSGDPRAGDRGVRGAPSAGAAGARVCRSARGAVHDRRRGRAATVHRGAGDAACDHALLLRARAACRLLRRADGQ